MEVWEALITFILFIVLVIAAYLADIKIWQQKRTHLEDELADQVDQKVLSEADKDKDVDETLRRLANEMIVRTAVV